VAIRIEPLTGRHDRRAFHCGESELDDWFQHRAGQDARRDVAQVFAAVDDQLGVVGFYSLSAFSIALDDLPKDLAKKLPRYDSIPAALIGRLARDERVRGQNLGSVLLADAIHRVLDARRQVAIFAIVVDAKTERARQLYVDCGFSPLPSRQDRLFLLTSTAEKARALTAKRALLK
jgi:GNAT superfamily N-acetyltransferase